MKKRKLLTLSLLGMLVSCRSYSEDKIIQELRNFYGYYIAENYKETPNKNHIRDTLKKYCTGRFLRRLTDEAGKCECDPITQSQDYGDDWVRTMHITSLKGNNKFHVCFQGFNLHCLIVTMRREDGKMKIDNIIDDGG